MTREEAITRIKIHKSVHKMDEPRAIHISEALDVAIKALEQNPYKDFCEFVAKMVLSDDFEENAGANAEFLCRKLSKLGIVKADEDKWVLAESEEKE